MKNRIFVMFTFCFGAILLNAQLNQDYSAGAVMQKLDKLNALGSALYIAAHPDDENTQLISYFANGRNFRTAYLSATRGDGGQNLIGTEIRESLGVLRTQELLAARRTDGGEQFFARANDFGYSKHPDETFSVWDRDKVLADFVWVIRNFKPDILVTRFSQVPGSSHGHHTASAILAMEAFELSGDSTAFPEQLKFIDVWQPSKIFYNIGLWSFRRSGKTFNEDMYLKLDVGGYNSNLGKSYTEISALSRSMHKSQGFGSSGSRGSEYEYFEQWGGAKAERDLFEGIDVSWSRVSGAGTDEISALLESARFDFDPSNPISILGSLIKARSILLRLPDQYWKEVKLAEIDELILLISGTYIEISCDQKAYAAGDTISANLEIINRSEADIVLSAVDFEMNDEEFVYNLVLKENQINVFDYTLVIPDDIEISQPYWLTQLGTTGMYSVDDQLLIGKGENDPLLMTRISIKVDDQFLDFAIPVVYKATDPVKGEVKQIVEIIPKAIVNLDSRAMVFVGNESKRINVMVSSGSGPLTGALKLDAPSGWSIDPQEHLVSLNRTGEEKKYSFNVTPSEEGPETVITASLKVGNQIYDRGRVEIGYDHIPTQTLYPSSQVKVVSLEANTVSGRIGYIMGAGDDVPYSLEQLGYEVDMLDEGDVSPENLAKYKAILLGVRAFNTLPWMAFKNQVLFDYSKAGGNLIVQYNTTRRLITSDVAPFPIKISRDRVTVENAPVTFLQKGHPVLKKPFKITADDFEGWVQERGLYFPSEWTEDFDAILSMNDPGEAAKKGSLLIAKYGKGYYCYTGISFFRELPAGVSGAYKLLINMIELGEK